MKKLRAMTALILACLLPATIVTFTPGCQAPVQRVVYNTLYTVGASADLAYSGYNDLVVAGKVSPDSLPVVAKAWNKYRAIFNLAVTVNQNNLNAPSSAEVIQAADEFKAIIKQFTN